jgi:hypothetical protein
MQQLNSGVRAGFNGFHKDSNCAGGFGWWFYANDDKRDKPQNLPVSFW